MRGVENQSFDKPDETRTFDKGRMDIVTLGGTTMGKVVFEPGWKWSECVKPLVGTDSCQVAHTGYAISGHMHVVMDDGSEGHIGEGEMFVIEPGHDAWIVGSKPFVALDIQGASQYAR